MKKKHLNTSIITLCLVKLIKNKETRLISKPVKLNFMLGKLESKISKGKISEN
jgi:hypothetical protein